MRNYKKYRSVVIDLFKLFLAEKVDKEGLNKGLLSVESIERKTMWFKFYQKDTLATTICEIDVNLHSNRNEEYTKECMQIAVDNPKGFQIYFS